MFEFMKKHKLIVVTGPQRSGTTIAAKMIAQDTGHDCLLEEAFSGPKWWGDFQKMYEDILARLKDDSANGAVYQVPSLSAFVHLLPDPVAVVFMMRNFDSIKKSEVRINWNDQLRQLKRYFRSEGEAAQTKYAVWKVYQKGFIEHSYEVLYDSLRDHPLWVPQEKRKHFGPRQTEEV